MLLMSILISSHLPLGIPSLKGADCSMTVLFLEMDDAWWMKGRKFTQKTCFPLCLMFLTSYFRLFGSDLFISGLTKRPFREQC